MLTGLDQKRLHPLEKHHIQGSTSAAFGALSCSSGTGSCALGLRPTSHNAALSLEGLKALRLELDARSLQLAKCALRFALTAQQGRCLLVPPSASFVACSEAHSCVISCVTWGEDPSALPLYRALRFTNPTDPMEVELEGPRAGRGNVGGISPK